MKRATLKFTFPGVPVLLYQVPSPYRAPLRTVALAQVGWDGWGSGKHGQPHIPGMQPVGANLSGDGWRAARADPVAAHGVDGVPQDGAHSARGHTPGHCAWKRVG